MTNHRNRLLFAAIQATFVIVLTSAILTAMIIIAESLIWLGLSSQSATLSVLIVTGFIYLTWRFWKKGELA